MTIENLSRLIEGEILTSPLVSSINNIEFSSKRVKNADAFVYTGIEDIKEAVSNGAYAVIFDREDVEIFDREIAWIKVKSLKKALIRILRFYLSEKSIKVFYANEILSDIIKSASLSKNIIFLNDSIYDIFQKIFHAKENATIIGRDKDLLEKIYPSFKEIEEEKGGFQSINSSLFENTFLYKGKIFKNIKIPPIFEEELKKALSFFEKNDIDYDLHNLNFIENHFEPVFINKLFVKKPFGSTQKVLIFEKDKKLLKKEADFIKKEAKWAKSVVFIPKGENIEDLGIEIYRFLELKNLKLIKNFHLGIIYGRKEDFLPLLEDKKTHSISLFEE